MFFLKRLEIAGEIRYRGRNLTELMQITKEQLIHEELTWYKDAIIYELHIKAFFDSNNDGIGDFVG
jgi:pullulanase/glycogen debranching enzyme